MDIKEQKNTFDGFVKLTKYSVFAGIATLVILAIVYKIQLIQIVTKKGDYSYLQSPFLYVVEV